MHKRFAGVLVLMCVVVFSAFTVAGDKKLGVANSYQVSFSEKVWVAGTLLPEGDYEIRHVMDGYKHVMVFRQSGVPNPAGLRAPCTIIPLPEMATDSQKNYDINTANERVLRELIFKGDTAKHVF